MGRRESWERTRGQHQGGEDKPGRSLARRWPCQRTMEKNRADPGFRATARIWRRSGVLTTADGGHLSPGGEGVGGKRAGRGRTGQAGGERIAGMECGAGGGFRAAV